MAASTAVLELPDRKKTGRNSAKVKTGCRTCKIRRVKCDEKKPDCVRCTSTGRQCDGYPQLASSNSQAIIPSQSSTLQGTIPVLSEFGDSVLYLEFYHHCAGPTLASNYDHEFWSRTVLQMAHRESSIRHAVIALGYLAKSEPGNLKHARSDSPTDNRKTLLLHYNKAVRCLVDRMAQSSYSPEIALVSCLLFICIEHLRGDYRAAFAHLHSGLKIIAEWQQRIRDSLQSSPTSSESSESSSNSVVISTKVDGPRLIADNLIPMFTRAISAALLMGAPFEPRLKGFCPDPQTLQGRSFASVLDAQSALYDLRNATILVVSILFRTLNVGNKPTTGDLHDRAHLLRCHDSWFWDLQMLEREGNLSSEDSVVASSLKVSYYATYMALAGATDMNQAFGGSFLDAHISSFQAVNHHAKIVIDSMNLPISSPSISQATPSSSSSNSSSTSGSKQAAAHFSFEISLIPSLFFVATRCRCPATRREAVSLLERNPPREALWDAKLHAMVGRRIIEIEESEIDQETGWPTHRSRLAAANIKDMEENGGFWVQFIKPDLIWDEWFVA